MKSRKTVIVLMIFLILSVCVNVLVHAMGEKSTEYADLEIIDSSELITKTNTQSEQTIKDDKLFSKQPSGITVYGYDRSVELMPTDKEFDQIISLNKNGNKFVERYSVADGIPVKNSDTVYIEYRFDDNHSFELITDDGEKQIQTDKMCFFVSDDMCGYVSIDTPDGTLTVGTLNVSTELIDFARDIVSLTA